MNIMIIEDNKGLREHIKLEIKNQNLFKHQSVNFKEYYKMPKTLDFVGIDLLICDKEIVGYDNAWEELIQLRDACPEFPKKIIFTTGLMDWNEFDSYEKLFGGKVIPKLPAYDYIKRLIEHIKLIGTNR